MKRIFVLLFVAISLGLFVFIYEIEGDKKRKQKKEYNESLFKLNNNDIKLVRLKNKSQIIQYEKNDNSWNITQPINLEVDKNIIDSQISVFLNSKVKRIIGQVDENKLKNYGLGSSNIELYIETFNGLKINYEIGDESATKGDLFVFDKDSNSVILSSNELKVQTQKTLFELRDKKIIHFDKSNVNQISIITEDDSIIIKNEDKINQLWKITSHDLNGDNSQIDNYLSSLNRYTAVDFIDNPEKNEKSYLKNSQISIVLNLEPNRNSKTLTIGESKISNSDTVHYGFESGKSNIFLISNNDKKSLMKDSFYFQDKKLVDYDENNINEINIMGAYQLSVMNEDSLGWYISSDSTIKLDKVDMNRLFSAINGIQAVELVKSKNQDSFGINEPFIEVLFNDSENNKKGFIIGNSDNNLNRYVKSNAVNKIYKATNNSIERLTNLINEFKGVESIE
ncbi:MAG: hypothetical protein CMG48_01590 [Candidatus Marinimicrobia bacterium]|nr:hypothetical protein [Candidatus Neomarinimicrobiota bacterium]